jgi:hypothetical protein
LADYLWLPIAAWPTDTNTPVAPSGYTDLVWTSSSDSATPRRVIATARKFLTASSEDPPAFSTGGTTGRAWVAVTLAVQGPSVTILTIAPATATAISLTPGQRKLRAVLVAAAQATAITLGRRKSRQVIAARALAEAHWLNPTTTGGGEPQVVVVGGGGAPLGFAGAPPRSRATAVAATIVRLRAAAAVGRCRAQGSARGALVVHAAPARVTVPAVAFAGAGRVEVSARALAEVGAPQRPGSAVVLGPPFVPRAPVRVRAEVPVALLASARARVLAGLAVAVRAGLAGAAVPVVERAPELEELTELLSILEETDAGSPRPPHRHD